MTSNPNPDAAARRRVPVWNQDTKFYEDYEIGEVDRSIQRTISEGEVMLFSSLLMDLHPYVADERFAVSEGEFGRRLVPGALVFSYGMGLMAHNNVNTFSYGYDRLRFIRPVFIGDTIYTMRTLLRKEPKYDHLGLFVVAYEVFRADDEELVLYTEHIQTVRYKHGARDESSLQSPESTGPLR